MRYTPQRDDAPDPGEVVWTWIPYEERDGRGKDRPALVVAQLSDRQCVVVSMTSTERSDGDSIALGSGIWDPKGRPSWAILDRVFVVDDAGMRREAGAIDVQTFGAVARRLRDRYGWAFVE